MKEAIRHLIGSGYDDDKALALKILTKLGLDEDSIIELEHDQFEVIFNLADACHKLKQENEGLERKLKESELKYKALEEKYEALQKKTQQLEKETKDIDAKELPQYSKQLRQW